MSKGLCVIMLPGAEKHEKRMQRFAAGGGVQLHLRRWRGPGDELLRLAVRACDREGLEDNVAAGWCAALKTLALCALIDVGMKSPAEAHQYDRVLLLLPDPSPPTGEELAASRFWAEATQELLNDYNVQFAWVDDEHEDGIVLPQFNEPVSVH